MAPTAHEEDDAQADARRWGIDPALVRPVEDATNGVWPEHAATVEAFLAIAGQWRMVAGMGGMLALGLDYAGAQAGLELAGIEATPALWADIRVIEAGAKAAMNGD